MRNLLQRLRCFLDDDLRFLLCFLARYCSVTCGLIMFFTAEFFGKVKQLICLSFSETQRLLSFFACVTADLLGFLLGLFACFAADRNLGNVATNARVRRAAKRGLRCRLRQCLRGINDRNMSDIWGPIVFFLCSCRAFPADEK